MIGDTYLLIEPKNDGIAIVYGDRDTLVREVSYLLGWRGGQPADASYVSFLCPNCDRSTEYTRDTLPGEDICCRGCERPLLVYESPMGLLVDELRRRQEGEEHSMLRWRDIPEEAAV